MYVCVVFAPQGENRVPSGRTKRRKGALCRRQNADRVSRVKLDDRSGATITATCRQNIDRGAVWKDQRELIALRCSAILRRVWALPGASEYDRLMKLHWSR